MKKTLLLTALALVGGMAHASIVSGTVTAVSPDTGSAGGTFTQLTTFPAGYKVGNNNINVNDTVFGFDEQQNLAFGDAPVFDKGTTPAATTLVSSHYVYFDPATSTKMPNQTITASVTFDSDILGVYWVTGTFDSKSKSGTGLKGSENNFGLTSGVTYKYHDLTGLEKADRDNTSFLGNTLTFTWRASTPGDHIRVITAAVPEPETYAMLLAGLGVMGAIARRRKAARA